MKLKERINSLVTLGQQLDFEQEDFQTIIRQTYYANRWFSESNLKFAISAIKNEFLDRAKLENFAAKYSINENAAKTVGMVFAGNIPLAGFHDFLCCFLSGNKAQIKLSSKDEILMKYILQQMETANQSFKEYYSIVEKLSDFDAVIATGSNNSSRYFEYYFGKHKNIIRKNRNAIAVLNGKESDEELLALGKDIFQYFGLGCRNVSKLFIPKNYDLTRLLSVLESYEDIINHDKYKNNYDYQFSIMLLNKVEHLASKNLLIKEDESIASPISVVYYQTYDNIENVTKYLSNRAEEIQCVISNTIDGALPFGSAQSPDISDFADNVDTMKFMLEI